MLVGFPGFPWPIGHTVFLFFWGGGVGKFIGGVGQLTCLKPGGRPFIDGWLSWMMNQILCVLEVIGHANHPLTR